MSSNNETIFEVGMKFDYYSPVFNVRKVAASTRNSAIQCYTECFPYGYISNMMISCKQVQ